MRPARDSQMIYNYMQTAAVERVALAPIPPVVAAEGQVDDYASEWVNGGNVKVARYKPVTVAGNLAPAPQRIQAPDVPTGFLAIAQRAEMDVQTTLGMYNASLGASSGEKSGRAIMARQREGDTATFHFIDNMARAIQSAGRILIEIIPSLYSTRRTIQILGDDERQRVERVTAEAGAPPSAEDPEGKIYNLAAGKYDVTVSVGPNYQTQRQQTVDAMTELFRANPAAAEVMGDMYVKNMDFPGSDKAAERIQVLQYAQGQKLGLPPAVLEAQFPEVARQFPPQPPPPVPGAPNPMQGAPPGALPVSGGM